MLPLLNGKSFLNCTKEDLNTLIGNTDYRENQYIDYKKTFSFLDKKGPERENSIAEFRSDVCSFANSEGGYLFYGISEKQGVAQELLGIEISNTDRFELERRNNLMAIAPKLPSLRFGFIPLESGKYIVVIEIKPDYYAPYIHIENEQNYRIYTRSGNGKITMKYDELKNMFNASLSFEQELDNFREKRIDYYKSQSESSEDEYSRFVLIHLIPRTFSDPSTHKMVYVDQRLGRKNYTTLVQNLVMDSTGIPSVDGIRFPAYDTVAEGRIYNSGIFECFFPKTYVSYPLKSGKEGCYSKDIWNFIKNIVYNYNELFCKNATFITYYACVSIIGCKGTISGTANYGFEQAVIDRDFIICPPVEMSLDDESSIDEDGIRELEVTYLLSMGIRYSQRLSAILEELKKDYN